MKILETKVARLTAMASLAISMVACHQAPSSSDGAAVRQNNSVTSLPPSDLEAAVEPFESLTEHAFSANPDQLETLVAKAKSSYRMVKPTLVPSQRADADRYLRILTTADQAADRSRVALASVEIYRLLLEAQNRDGDPVIRAGLLDYAGFRYGALAQADEIDWAEMSRTTRFAQFEWRRLSHSIESAPLRERFSNSLTIMLAAAAKRDQVAARKAAENELQLVDLLENQIETTSG